MKELYIAALSMGLIGSFHCIGMCGPIAIAIPSKHLHWKNKILDGILYNAGRTLTYGLMGAVFGLLGKGFKLSGLQQGMSVIMGTIIIFSVLMPVLYIKLTNIDKFLNKLLGRLKIVFEKAFSTQSHSSLFTIGILNGFLPCGLVYLAITGAVASGDIWSGWIYMILFGLGTIPVMLTLTLTSKLISHQFRNKIKKIIPIFIIILGILLILRGMNLGIMYISPDFSEAKTTIIKHH